MNYTPDPLGNMKELVFSGGNIYVNKKAFFFEKIILRA